MKTTKDNAPRSKPFIFHVDPGHGWLEVSFSDLFRAGLVAASFSAYSYIDHAEGKMYLEEDSDLAIFAHLAGPDFATAVTHHRHDAPLRNLPRNRDCPAPAPIYSTPWLAKAVAP